MSIYIKALLLPYFQYNYFNILRLTFCNKYCLPFLHSLNIRKMGAKIRQKTSSCINRFVVFYSFFSLKFKLPRPKENLARVFILFKYFVNNLVLTVFIQNVISKFVKVLPQNLNNSFLCSSLLEPVRTEKSFINEISLATKRISLATAIIFKHIFIIATRKEI